VLLFRVKKHKQRNQKMFSKPKKPSVSEAPPEIKELYHRYSDEGGIMTASHLRSFLIEVQKEEKITEEETQAIIDRRDLNLESFFKFLFADNNPPLLPSTGVILFYLVGY
jgi:phosphatidylinositol phospholipase C, delta